MKEMTVNEFQTHLETAVSRVIENHAPLRITGRGSDDFVVVSDQDWEREQETLYVLQSRSLMEKIERSLKLRR